MDHHTLAVVSLVGSSLDVLGALYLAYDLLGGEHGPLRALSRGVTYGILFALAFGIPLGPVFGIAAGVTHGFTLAWEFSRASRGRIEGSLWVDAIASAIRGLGHGIGAAWILGPAFGILFGGISTLSQIVAYRMGIRPGMEYAPERRLRLTRRQLLAAVNRTIGYGAVAALLCAKVAGKPEHALAVGLRFGLTIGVATTISSSMTSWIEYAADHVPEKRMGVFGVALILAGFSLQSLQYWMSLLDIPVK